MNKVQIGKSFEEEAKNIFKEEKIEILEKSSEINWCSHYDFIVKKENIEYYVEVRGRKEGKNIQYFSISKDKLKHLRELNKEVLILLINRYGYVIFNLNLIKKYTKRYKIRNKIIYILTHKKLDRKRDRKKNREIIIKIRKTKTKQMQVTIPFDSDIKAGDYVKIKKVGGD